MRIQATQSIRKHIDKTIRVYFDRDVMTLVKKDKDYGSSWKRRGGVGAFMNVARKWDRVETQVSTLGGGDIYSEKLWNQKREDPFIDDVRDLRGYLLLCLHEQLGLGFWQLKMGTAEAHLSSTDMSSLIAMTGTEMMQFLCNESWNRYEIMAKDHEPPYDIFHRPSVFIPAEFELLVQVYIVEALAKLIPMSQPRHPYDRDDTYFEAMEKEEK